MFEFAMEHWFITLLICIGFCDMINSIFKYIAIMVRGWPKDKDFDYQKNNKTEE